MMRCPNCGTLISSPYKGCPVCGWAVQHPLLRHNPPPSTFPDEKHKVVKYCNVCDMHIVKKRDFDKCPNCGARVY